MTTPAQDPAAKWLAPLFGAMARNEFTQAWPLLEDALRHIPNDPRVQAVRLDLPLMEVGKVMATGARLSGNEGPYLDRAYDMAKEAMTSRFAGPATKRMAAKILLQLGGGEEIERLGGFAEVGRAWAQAGRHDVLLQQMPRVRSHADRLELMEQHRIAARALEAKAAENPVRRAAHGPHGRQRIGFLSADLRAHVVGSFALPLFEHLDPGSVELFCYSGFLGPPDIVEKFVRSRSTFREIGRLSDAAAAQLIADDQLDILIDLGGSTGDNRLGVMAYRPAPITISWMGYPHSTGLKAIDYILLDPHLKPPSADMLSEAPLLMPKAWISLARLQFSQAPPADPTPPQVRKGAVTFGTANQPLKYSPAALAAWAKVLLAVPGSTFLIFRPECASARFRDKVIAAFASHGVAAGRLTFEAVRGAGYLDFYNQLDVSLDTFPLTGGTTTCESVWMGVPVVSMVGEALFERLSYSILVNAGLGDLCAFDEASYVEKAAAAAADVERLRDLRQNLRGRIMASSFGDGPGFARDFYRLMADLQPTEGAAANA